MTLVTSGASAASPTATDPNATAQAGTEGDANAAASSTVDEDAKEPSLLDVVKSAIVEAPGPTDTSAVEGEEGKPKAEAETVTTGEEQATDDSNLPFHEHPRWKQVIAERNAFEQDAQSYRKITGFMETNGLTADEMADVYDVSAKLKSGDPARLQEALDYLEPRVATLRAQLGHVLPDDLQQKVDEGLLDEESAQEVARSRATTTLTTQRTERQREAASQEEAQRENLAKATELATAVNDWEKGIKASDPDYAKKADLVMAKTQALVMSGKVAPPTTKEQAVALAKTAYDEVSQAFASALPPPKPIKPTPRGSSTPTVHEPATLKDAIRGAISRA